MTNWKPVAGGGRIERLDRDGLRGRQAGVEQALGSGHGARLWRAAVDPQPQGFELVGAERRQRVLGHRVRDRYASR